VSGARQQAGPASSWACSPPACRAVRRIARPSVRLADGDGPLCRCQMPMRCSWAAAAHACAAARRVGLTPRPGACYNALGLERVSRPRWRQAGYSPACDASADPVWFHALVW